MSKSLVFTDQENIINVNYSRQRFPSKLYSQTFLNIQVTTPDNPDPFLDIDIDDNFTFLYFECLSQFFNHLNKHKNQNIARLINDHQISFMIEGQQEIIPLNYVQMVTEKQHQYLSKRVNFYNDAFKTKMISKFEKIIKSHYKNAKEQNKMEKKGQQKLYTASIISGGQIVFSILSSKVEGSYILNYNCPYQVFDIQLEQFFEKDLKIRIQQMRNDKVIIAVQYQLWNPEVSTSYKQRKVKRVCQFNKSYSSSLRIEQGQNIGVSIEEGQLIIRNIETNNGKMFAESIANNEQDWRYRIIISLEDI